MADTSSQIRTIPDRRDRSALVQFPWNLVPLLRCIHDGGQLLQTAQVRSGELGVIDANLLCLTCSASYQIRDGIARMLPSQLSKENEHEIAIRDEEYALTHAEPFVAPADGWRSELNDLVEIPPFLRELEPLENRRVLELGCGDGRLTMLMAQMGASVMAVDFSLNALRRMGGWLASGDAPTAFQGVWRRRDRDLRPYVGLVHADASLFRMKPESFDRALSATPLDSRDERMAMYRAVAEALRDGGRYIGSYEHDDLTRRLLGLPVARRYQNDGIFIEHFDASTVHRESAPYFAVRRVYPIRPRVPFVSRLPHSWAARALRTCGKVPLLRDLGEILLLRAERPVRAPLEGANRPGNGLIRGLFRSYARKLGKEPVWGTDERVV